MSCSPPKCVCHTIHSPRCSCCPLWVIKKQHPCDNCSVLESVAEGLWVFGFHYRTVEWPSARKPTHTRTKLHRHWRFCMSGEEPWLSSNRQANQRVLDVEPIRLRLHVLGWAVGVVWNQCCRRRFRWGLVLAILKTFHPLMWKVSSFPSPKYEHFLISNASAVSRIRVWVLPSVHWKGGYAIMLCDGLSQFTGRLRTLQMCTTFGQFEVCILSTPCTLQLPRMLCV